MDARDCATCDNCGYAVLPAGYQGGSNWCACSPGELAAGPGSELAAYTAAARVASLRLGARAGSFDSLREVPGGEALICAIVDLLSEYAVIRVWGLASLFKACGAYCPVR